MTTQRFAGAVGLLLGVSLLGFAHCSAQVVPSDSRFLYRPEAGVRTDLESFRRFQPVAPWGGVPTECLEWETPFPDRSLPKFSLYGPSWESRLNATFLWIDDAGTVLRAQIVRHKDALPLIDPSNGARVVDPMTPLTAHTIVSLDFEDSTVAAFNWIDGRANEGVSAKLGAYPTLPLVLQSMEQVAAATKKCKLPSRS